MQPYAIAGAGVNPRVRAFTHWQDPGVPQEIRPFAGILRGDQGSLGAAGSRKWRLNAQWSFWTPSARACTPGDAFLVPRLTGQADPGRVAAEHDAGLDGLHLELARMGEQLVDAREV